MHSKRRYKICVCSVIVGQLESFRNYRGSVGYHFSENFLYNLANCDNENFSYSSLHHIFESQNFRFPFFDEK